MLQFFRQLVVSRIPTTKFQKQVVDFVKNTIISIPHYTVSVRIFMYVFAPNLSGVPAVVVSIVLAVSPDNYGLITTGKVSVNGPDEL